MSDRQLTLYYSYASYFSQKAFLALLEKGCKFEKKFINIHVGEQNTPEYMRMNPNGLVPMLKDGPKIVVESEQIIDYLDEKVKTGSQLVPDESTPIGKEVKRLRKLLDEVTIDVITYGIVYNNELSTTGVKIPKFMLKKMKNNAMEKVWEETKEKAEKYPDLRDAYLNKLEMRRSFMKNVRDIEIVSQHLEDLDKKCDQLEDCLKRVKQGATSEQEIWIAGPQFTAADIILIVLMDRMTLLGLEDRYFSKDKRPLLFEYRERINKRKSVQMLRAEVKKAFGAILWQKVKSSIPYVASAATLGVAVGVGLWFLKKK